MKNAQASELGKRIVARREALGLSQETLASAVGMTQQGIASIERGTSARPRLLHEIAKALRTHEEWLLTGAGPEEIGEAVPNARIGEPVSQWATVPVYGQAVGGDDGRFVLNGNKVTDILAPPFLAGVPDAYAVYVVGESMEPRYYPREVVYVNPRQPVRRGDDVVVQVRGNEGDPPYAFIKQFVSREARVTRLNQFNPPKRIIIPTEKIVSIHRIMFRGPE